MSNSAPGTARTRLFVAKDEHKFSCAHMTIFADGTKERLHGHNYHLACAVELDPLGAPSILDFALVKQTLTALCAELREHLLVPRNHPQVRIIRQDGAEIELRVCDRRYVLPADEVLLLPVANLVVEDLAQLLWSRVVNALGRPFHAAQVVTVEVTVTESPGQGATYRAPMPSSTEEYL